MLALSIMSDKTSGWLLLGVLGLGGIGLVAALADSGPKPRRRRRSCKRITPRQIRREAEAAGVDLTDLHVCHIVAKANGGPDVRDNLVLCPAKFNLRTGARNDAEIMSRVGPLRARRAIEATRRCGE